MIKSSLQPSGMAGLERLSEVSGRSLAALDVAATHPSPVVREAPCNPQQKPLVEAASIDGFGFISPIVIDADGRIVAGHGRYQAAERFGREDVPVIEVSHLTPAEVRAYAPGYNKIAQSASAVPCSARTTTSCGHRSLPRGSGRPTKPSRPVSATARRWPSASTSATQSLLPRESRVLRWEPQLPRTESST